MKTIVISDNNNLRGTIVTSENDFKTAYKKYKNIEEIIYSENSTFFVRNVGTAYSETFEASMFDGDASSFSISVNVRNKVSSNILIGEANALVIDKRLNVNNYRDLDGIEKIQSKRVGRDFVEVGIESVLNATVSDKQRHLIKTEYDKEDGVTKGIMLECQSASYFELMPVVESKIIGVLGLPPGMVFEFGKIKGSPSKAGDYRGLITLANGKTINLLIKVSRIRRMF